MKLKDILKRTLLYKYVYYPYSVKKSKERKQRMHETFVKEGKNVLKAFVECMNANHITYWLEYGSLLGAYRDGDFVPNELDLDVGVYLNDVNKVYHAMKNAGFKLVREFHVVGENGLEQTYEYNGITIDLMYFYEMDGMMWCNGVIFAGKLSSKFTEYAVTAHHFKPFSCTTFDFLGMEVSIPSNAEEHLIETYGSNFRVYDPNFKVDLNKVFYSIDEKRAAGFAYR